MKTITFSSIKGGTAKTTLSILTANCLASAGYRVLTIDLDIQNSLTFYYLDNPEVIEESNIAFAFGRQTFNGNIIQSNYSGIDIVPSSFNLVDLRVIHVNKLQRMLPQIEEEYDFCIIDTGPTYDNIVLNAINVSNMVFTPAKLSQFDYKSLLFYQEKLLTETDNIDSWNILFTFYQTPRSDNGDNLLNQYLSLFQSTFSNILPIQIPLSIIIQKTIDTKEVLSNTKKKAKVFEPIKQLAEYIAEKPIAIERC